MKLEMSGQQKTNAITRGLASKNLSHIELGG